MSTELNAATPPASPRSSFVSIASSSSRRPSAADEEYAAMRNMQLQAKIKSALVEGERLRSPKKTTMASSQKKKVATATDELNISGHDYRKMMFAPH